MNKNTLHIGHCSSLKKRDTAVSRKTSEGSGGEKAENSKSEENDAKSDDDDEKDSEKKKNASKKSTATDATNESEDKKETESTEENADAAVGEEAPLDKSTDNEGDEKKSDDKEKRKKFVRLWCVHCRIESATFKVMTKKIFENVSVLTGGKLINMSMLISY